MNCDGIQAIEQVLAKTAGAHFFFGVAIRGRNDADVDALSLIRPDAPHFAFLHCAQQLHLESQTSFGNLIEEDRATISLLPKSPVIDGRTCERTAHVSEQL